MKTFKTIVESLPPHLQGKFSTNKGFEMKDVSPSFSPDKTMLVPLNDRQAAVDIMKKQRIRFSSTGTSSGNFRFQDIKMYKKAISAMKKAGIKVIQ